MANTLQTIDLSTNSSISARSVSVDRAVYGIDVNQTNGNYVVVEPYELDGSAGGKVIIYPQSTLQVASIVEYQTFNKVGSLLSPRDARFDWVRNKLWIADTGNNRVLKVNLNTNEVDVNISSGLIYPHALVVDINTGNVFVRGFQSYNLNYGLISYFQKDGVALGTFAFEKSYLESSSSSDSSEEFSSEETPSSLPYNRSMAIDNNRQRLWWVDGVKVYAMDIRGKQIRSYDVRNNNYHNTFSIDIESNSGNAFVVVSDLHDEKFVIQMSRDNNEFLGMAYVGA